MDLDWESLWAPYDPHTYEQVLAWVRPDDRVLDIGAGDLRLSWAMAGRAQGVWAVETQTALVDQAITGAGMLPPNLSIICADARHIPFPSGITMAVLLMRHCTHFGLYVRKLLSTGCRRLATNARWRSGVELIDLTRERRSYQEILLGWYGCLCGGAGFKPGPVEALTPETEGIIHEVKDCPHCRSMYG